ncbi:hypothetical protein WJX73_010196 [Symbiochloris irregularis]|uniref:glucose-1-phosphate adenylyltransferase n=1 Tax=Symbiochloris irregularis TaxID=706552 RepID=A0AAW1NWL0_9CHLO
MPSAPGRDLQDEAISAAQSACPLPLAPPAAQSRTLDRSESTNLGINPRDADKPKKLKRQVTLRKIARLTVDDISRKVHAVILAGGPQNNPLARFRAMPAVELGANTQLIDVTISNCLRSGINKLYVLTQFNSHTLNTHITTAYPPAVFGGVGRQGFVDVLAAHQTPDSDGWHRGSADAVRRNLPAILEKYRGVGMPDELVVLSGEAIYSMDYSQLVKTHREQDADITIATHSVSQEVATQRGLVRVDPETGVVTQFYEKPSGATLETMAHASRNATPDKPFEASMGVYVFGRDVLVSLLGPPSLDNTDSGAHFGLDIIPKALRDDFRVCSHHFDGYFRPITCLRDFYEINLELAHPSSPISLVQADEAIESRGHMAPPSTIHQCEITNTLIGEGTVLRGSVLNGCVVGCNTFVGPGCELENTLLMGNDGYNNDALREEFRRKGEPIVGIGDGSVIKNAIIDSNACIGRNVRITNEKGVQESDCTSEGYVIHDGITCVLKNAIIPDGFQI